MYVHVIFPAFASGFFLYVARRDSDWLGNNASLSLKPVMKMLPFVVRKAHLTLVLGEIVPAARISRVWPSGS